MSLLTRLGLPSRVTRPATRPDAAGVQAAAGLAAAVGPDCVEVSPRWLRLGWGYAATFAVTRLGAVDDVLQGAGLGGGATESGRCVYAGIVEHSVYVDPTAHRRGVKQRLLRR
jgi:GNAT superfamily N-acetyltransferase